MQFRSPLQLPRYYLEHFGWFENSMFTAMLLPDYPACKEALAEYRQALREVPEQPGFPEDIIWPEKP